MTDQFAIFCCGGCRKVGDPRIDPSYGIRDISTINRNFISDKKILRDILFDPFTVLNLLLDRPSTFPHLPHLESGLLNRLAEARVGEEDKKQQNKKRHIL
jgi:hypothetical protein